MLPDLWDKLTGRRRSERIKQPRLKVRVDGRAYRTIDWSLGGVRIADYPRPVQRLDRVDGTLKIPGGPSGEFTGEVIWMDDAGQVGLRFIEIAPDVFLELMTLQHS
ncbi:PilZ domain-containing protein [Ferruginivarius sediminum]|uniref:PilZ domain-containing protein n=1 Tax=Ferruginivarius sediminum TaxID=2661937 RepID=A0A369TH47_9PROT|nr:PilZ domain-containing protein [Ferruginivarius sediminum]RDD62236.1 PilZ domain-containing protein [Ferruginivarius sediminum]